MQKIKLFFSSQELRIALILALCFSSFIYLFHFELEFYVLNTLLALYAFYLLIISSRKTLFFAGFLIGLLWFYWIGFSFRYYDLAWAVPLVAIAFAFIYGFIFWVVSWPTQPLLRASMLFLLSLFEPFDFNWLQPELLFVHSYFGIEKWQYGLILLAFALYVQFKEKKGYLFLLLLLPALSFSDHGEQKLPLNISLVQTDLQQDIKWEHSYLPVIVKKNLEEIDKAIEGKKDLVILPESAYPLFLNRHSELIQALKIRSYEIAIITGSLYYENGHNFNATYFFQDGTMQIAKKMILVPFGEYIPLPSFLAKPINTAIFGGASDFLTANEPTDFAIKKTLFRNAVCYEATCHELFEDKPKLMIATSNNAWFAPSIQPTLQRLLMQFYATKSHTVIVHSANNAGGGIIYP